MIEFVNWSAWSDSGMQEYGNMSWEALKDKLHKLRKQAIDYQKATDADHVIYARKIYNEVNGELDEVRFYMIALADKDFYKRVDACPNDHIYAVHRHN